MNRIHSISKKKIESWFWPMLLVMIAIALYSKGLWNEEVFYFDADRIAMDGVYFQDLLHDRPIFNLYDYTINYYARYPALSIGFRECFFQILLGFLYTIFGISMVTAKIGVLIFAALGAVFLYKLVMQIYNTKVAIISSLLFITTPYVFLWTRVPMLEIPALAMSIISIYYFHNYVEFNNKLALQIFVIIFALTLWTKALTIFLIPFFLIYLTIRKKWSAFLNREILKWYGLFIIMFIPLVWIILWLGKFNFQHSISFGKVYLESGVSRFSATNISYYIKELYLHHLTLPVIGISIIGITTSLVKKDKRAVLFFVWIAAVYVTFSYIRMKDSRYAFYWIPAFCVLGASLFEHLNFCKKWLAMAGLLTIIFVILFNIIGIQRLPNFNAAGFKDAAEYVVKNPKGYTIFYDGSGNGAFIFWVRKFDKNKKFIVLRGSKLVVSSAINVHIKQTIHVHSSAEIRELFSNYGTIYVIVEKLNKLKTPILTILREFLKSNEFRLVREIPIKISEPSPLDTFKEQSILIYEFLGPTQKPKGELKIPIPSADLTITVSIEKLISE